MHPPLIQETSSNEVDKSDDAVILIFRFFSFGAMEYISFYLLLYLIFIYFSRLMTKGLQQLLRTDRTAAGRMKKNSVKI